MLTRFAKIEDLTNILAPEDMSHRCSDQCEVVVR